jgi:hypothetical protein
MGETRNAYIILVGKPEGKYHSEERGIEGWDVVDWIHLAQDREPWRAVVNMVVKLRVT